MDSSPAKGEAPASPDDLEACVARFGRLPMVYQVDDRDSYSTLARLVRASLAAGKLMDDDPPPAPTTGLD